MTASVALAPLLPTISIRTWWLPYVPIPLMGLTISIWAYLTSGPGARKTAARPVTAGWIATLPVSLGVWGVLVSQALADAETSGFEQLGFSTHFALLAIGTLGGLWMVESRFHRAPAFALLMSFAFGQLAWLQYHNAWNGQYAHITLPAGLGPHTEAVHLDVLCMEVGEERTQAGLCGPRMLTVRALDASTPASVLRPGDVLLVEDGRKMLPLTHAHPQQLARWEDGVVVEPIPSHHAGPEPIAGVGVKGRTVGDVAQICSHWEHQCTVMQDIYAYPTLQRALE